jgi:hypothetical protein
MKHTFDATSDASSLCGEASSSAAASSAPIDCAISNQNWGTAASRPRKAAPTSSGSGSESRARRPLAEVARDDDDGAEKAPPPPAAVPASPAPQPPAIAPSAGRRAVTAAAAIWKEGRRGVLERKKKKEKEEARWLSFFQSMLCLKSCRSHYFSSLCFFVAVPADFPSTASTAPFRPFYRWSPRAPTDAPGILPASSSLSPRQRSPLTPSISRSSVPKAPEAGSSRPGASARRSCAREREREREKERERESKGTTPRFFFALEFSALFAPFRAQLVL